MILRSCAVARGAARPAATRSPKAQSHALTVGIACAIVGIIIGMMTLTGVGTIFAGYVIDLGSRASSWRCS